MTFRSNGTTEAEYWSNFEVIKGKIKGPFVVATINNDRRVNSESWYRFQKRLSSNLKQELDSLFYPMKVNSLHTEADTLFDYSKKAWKAKSLSYQKRSIRIDTVLGGDIEVVLEQLPVFHLNYYFSIEGSDKYFEISPGTFEEVSYWAYNKDTPYEEFMDYKYAVDELIGNSGFLKITALKTNKEGWHIPYIIKNGEGDELFNDKEGFERLKIAKEELGSTGTMYRNPFSGKVDEKFILWHDSWVFRIIASIATLAIVIQIINLLISAPAVDEQSSD